MSEEIKIPVKLFVSKFPQNMTEDALREIFAEFGEIESLVILKSKDPTRNQGCGFVRFTSIANASRAIRELNGKHVVDSDVGPINVEYASGEAERLNLPSTAEGTSVKLFVGGVPLNMSDEELAGYFGEFGTVTECHALPPKTNNPLITTKAAFVRFSRKAEAMAAIDTCDKKRAFPGVDRAMDVRVAEANKTVENNPPYHQQGARLAAGSQYDYTQQSSSSHLHHGGHHHLQQQGYPPQMGGPSRYPGMPMGQRPDMQNLSGYRNGMPGGQAAAPLPVSSSGGPRTIGSWTEYFSPEGKAYYHNAMTNVTTWDQPPEFGPMRQGNVSSYAPGMYPPVNSGTPSYAPSASYQMPGAAGGSGPDAKGPQGANLFVFHIPIEWTDSDLNSQFARFGHIVSCRIVRERDTNRPKGFGFVSFDNAVSASTAVQGMNGMMVSNGKRLKVSIKKGEEFGGNSNGGGSFGAGGYSGGNRPTYPY